MNHREYLASIGAKGGAKSKRKLTKKQAREMAARRWERVKAAQAGAPGKHGSAKAHERANTKRTGAGN